MTEAFREYLHRLRKLTEKLEESEAALEELWAVCTKVTAGFDRVGSSGGGGDAKDGSLAAYADLTGKREADERMRRETEHELAAFLDAVEGAAGEHGKRDALILRERYLRCRGWQRVMDELIGKGYSCKSLRTVFKWHLGAVERAEKIWEETCHEQGNNPAGT